MQSRTTQDNNTELQARLQELAQEVVAEVSKLDAVRGKEVLGRFVSELFLSVAEQERREYRRQKQADGIAAAKARGVRFGAPVKGLPENFNECREAWRSGQMSLRQAAGVCGMSHTAFRDAVLRAERSA